MTSTNPAAILTVRAIEAFERPTPLRLPFRFGVVTLREAPQAFLRAHVELPDGRRAWGHAAELMVPKWFDKRPELTNEENVEQLRHSIRSARDVCLGMASPATAASLARAVETGQRRRLSGENGLVAGYGPSLVARAVLDALCRMEGISFYEAVRTNRIGLHADDLPSDLRGFDIDRFLAGLEPSRDIEARHTVGLADAVFDADVRVPVADGLPESLEAAIARYGHRTFKVKVSGQPDADLDRLARIAEVLDRVDDYRVTLDGNEQFADVGALAGFLERMWTEPRLVRFAASILYVEQPLPRAVALDRPLGALAGRIPFIIDESDDDEASFVRARALGYRGISSKTCKGIYRSLVNAARCAHWRDGGPYFLSAEDLTTQAGIAVQQDLALVSLLGLRHVERNGHHYVDGMAGATEAEMDRFARAHRDLYRRDATGLHLVIADGRIRTGSLACIGYATGAEPRYEGMRPIA